MATILIKCMISDNFLEQSHTRESSKWFRECEISLVKKGKKEKERRKKNTHKKLTQKLEILYQRKVL